MSRKRLLGTTRRPGGTDAESRLVQKRREGVCRAKCKRDGEKYSCDQIVYYVSGVVGIKV